MRSIKWCRPTGAADSAAGSCQKLFKPGTVDPVHDAQSEADASIYRRRFVPELLIALHDSPLADGGARGLALRTLCRAAAVPSLARQLTSHSGEV